MGIKIEKQILNGIYPTKEVFYHYYIEENHSIIETAKRFNVTRNVVINLIDFFDVHKDNERHFALTAAGRIKNNNYPTKEELLKKYEELQTWEKVREFYNIAKTTFQRLRFRLGLKEEPNEILSNKDKLIQYINSYDHKPTGIEITNNLHVTQTEAYYWIEKFGLSFMLHHYGSSHEVFLSNFLKQYNFRKDRTVLHPYELDFYNKDLNIAIEFNGDYWHSEKFKHKKYHFNKSQQCDKKNIKLIHVYEFEFVNNKDKILDYLSKLLNSTPVYTINDYFCKLTQINSKTYKVQTILNNTNLVLNNMVFQKKSKNNWEMIEYHVELNNYAQNSNLEMFNLFIKTINPNSVIYKCNYNKDNGKELLEYGMFFQKFLPPKQIGINDENQRYIIYDAGIKVFKYQREVTEND